MRPSDFRDEKKLLHMILDNISVINYRNISHADIAFSPKLNCFLGLNGMGKTNLLDAIYFLSFCKSSIDALDSHNIKHDKDFFVINGLYTAEDGEKEDIYCGMKKGVKKVFKRNKKEYSRFSDHIGFAPLVMVSPADTELILGGSEERRKFIDVVISQYDKEYLSALINYNKALSQRNALLKLPQVVDDELMEVSEEVMATYGKVVHQKRQGFISQFIPLFQDYYCFISDSKEKAFIDYRSHLSSEISFSELLRTNRDKDRIMGYSLKGVHKDELVMQLEDYPLKKEGSQGQSKTFLIALKLAQFSFLKNKGGKTPILLLDDIFDKLDATRVEKLIQLVSGSDFGQIFITDTNREHMADILNRIGGEHKVFEVNSGEVKELSR